MEGSVEFQALQKYCRRLPGVTEEYPWGHPTWKVCGKMFAIADPADNTVSLKATHENQAILCQDPAIVPAPYLAKGGWVMVTMSDPETGAMARELVAEGYDLIRAKLPKKVQAELPPRPNP